MKRFATLFHQLDQTSKTQAKLDAIEAYFRQASEADAAWALHFLCGNKLKRVVKTTALRSWAAQEAHLPDWLFAESYEAAGDLAETMALILPQPHTEEDQDDSIRELSLSSCIEHWIAPLAKATESEQKQSIVKIWRCFDAHERLVFNKLLTGTFRVGVAKGLVIRALAKALECSHEWLTHRLMGDWRPTAEAFRSLKQIDAIQVDSSKPYPFFLASTWDPSWMQDSQPQDWAIEWKWDGIRAQWIHRGGESYLWSRGDELMTDRFPELQGYEDPKWNGFVMDGELVAYRHGCVLPFADLQKRIGRIRLNAKTLQETPIAFLAFDLLEWQGNDLRGEPWAVRRERLETIVAAMQKTADDPEDFRLSNDPLPLPLAIVQVSQILPIEKWEDLAMWRDRAREMRAEGVMIKHRASPYRIGRTRGDWWKWKIDPWSIDAVLLYAERGHGRRAGLYTDYTFGLWNGAEWIPFAKAYSGLTDEEIREVDAWIRSHSTEKYGNAIKVEPQLVFEVGFEGIQRSNRHKSGIAVRFPRILKWRHDKQVSDADTMETLHRLLESHK